MHDSTGIIKAYVTWEKRTLCKQTRIILFSAEKVHLRFKAPPEPGLPTCEMLQSSICLCKRINGEGALLKWKPGVLQKLT